MMLSTLVSHCMIHYGVILNLYGVRDLWDGEGVFWAFLVSSKYGLVNAVGQSMRKVWLDGIIE
jgi:hypothetical protein